TVNFGLRSPGEQATLVGGFARWLHSLDTPVQILARAHRVDLTHLADSIAGHAPTLPDPALEGAAHSHAQFLAELAAGHELLARRVTLAVRDTRGPAYAAHRAAEAARALGACEVTAHTCDEAAARAALAGTVAATPPGGATPDAVITGPAASTSPWSL
ncbi:MAG: PrgI family protein, partial [Acidimicrobiia bacterium]